MPIDAPLTTEIGHVWKWLDNDAMCIPHSYICTRGCLDVFLLLFSARVQLSSRQ